MNLKLLTAFIFLIAFSVMYISYQTEIKILLRQALEWKHLNMSLWLFIISSFSVHYLSVSKIANYENSIIFKHFGVFADSAFAAITYGLAATTSASILKGVYVQEWFEDKIYFNNFNDIDIYSMLVVCVFLFGYSLWACISSLKNAILIGTSTSAEAFRE
jgi:hypothetical protein